MASSTFSILSNDIPINHTRKKKITTASTIVKLKPDNLDAAMITDFISSSPRLSPVFHYRHNISEVMSKMGQVDFSLLSLAEWILKNHTPPAHLSFPSTPSRSGQATVTGLELLSHMQEYVCKLGLQRVVKLRSAPGILSVANVLKPGSGDSRQNRNYHWVLVDPSSVISKDLVPGICAHELGTHLLRMINDDKQLWCGCSRPRFDLKCHLRTEEGLATLNTLYASKSRTLWSAALHYWAVCRGSKIGFAALFEEALRYLPDPLKSFKLCVRVKRGLINTDLPGACNLDQNYLRGSVELLLNLDRIDFGLLYCGQLAVEDLPKIKFLARRTCLKLPPFLSTSEQYSRYMKELGHIADFNNIKKFKDNEKS